MLNLNEDLKPIGYYIKDRERMLNEMFRCVRGHRLQAILPNGFKVMIKTVYFYKIRRIIQTSKKVLVRLIIHPYFR
jgi:hypothetical protein